jgi:hypothetical protein
LRQLCLGDNRSTQKIEAEIALIVEMIPWTSNASVVNHPIELGLGSAAICTSIRGANLGLGKSDCDHNPNVLVPSFDFQK